VNINLNNAAGGTVSAGSVETVNINSSVASGVLTLTDAAATLVTVSGTGALSLTTTSATVTASSLSGALTITAGSTGAATITGGLGNDQLTAHTGSTIADVLIGGAGNDTLTSNAGLTTLTGGTGADTFVVASVTSSVNVYTTITDASVGDILKLSNQGTETFTTAKVVLGDTASFRDYANAVVNAGGNAGTDGKIGWFQFSGNTYVVESLHDATTTANFTDGTDLIVKLTGLVDLSTASLNTGSGPTLLIC